MLICLFWCGGLVGRAATIYYVATNGAGGDFLSWGTAASSIQDAISKATTAGDIVLVSNGVYQTGGVTNWPSGSTSTNRVAITNAITVMSANSNPANTIIKGQFSSGEPGAEGTVTNGPAAVRCVYMMNNSSAKLIGFTLTNGATSATGGGGGAYSDGRGAIISNCVIAGNSAAAGGGTYLSSLYNCTISGNTASGNGGGAYGWPCDLYNCLMSGNRAEGAGGAASSGPKLCNCTLTGNSAIYGGAVSDSTLYNCLMSGNSATYGGGAYSGTTMYNCTLVSNSASSYGGGVYNGPKLYNCIVYFNRATTSGSNWYGAASSFTNCCTAPAATGTGNITDNPMLVDTNAPDYNYRLGGNSPCIDRGTNYSWMSDGSITSKDLDGRGRIRYSAVDMGSYERIHEGTIYKAW